MSTVKQIITSSLRKLGIVGEGETPSQYAYADALQTLQGLIRGLITTGTFGRLRDVTPAGSYVAGENERVFRTAADPYQVIELPDIVSDQIAVCEDYGRIRYTSEGQRPVRDCAVVTLTDIMTGNVVDYIFDGQQKRWFPIFNLSLDYQPDSDPTADARLNAILALDCPLSYGDPNGLSSYLAWQIAPEYSAPVQPQITTAKQQFLIALTHSYSTRVYGRRR